MRHPSDCFSVRLSLQRQYEKVPVIAPACGNQLQGQVTTACNDPETRHGLYPFTALGCMTERPSLARIKSIMRITPSSSLNSWATLLIRSASVPGPSNIALNARLR